MISIIQSTVLRLEKAYFAAVGEFLTSSQADWALKAFVSAYVLSSLTLHSKSSAKASLVGKLLLPLSL